MTYKLKFIPGALKEFKKLDANIRSEFKKVLKRRLESPIIEKHRLYGDLKGHFKIKLKSSGYRLIYRVIENEFVVIVVGRRNKIYKKKY